MWLKGSHYIVTVCNDRFCFSIKSIFNQKKLSERFESRQNKRTVIRQLKQNKIWLVFKGISFHLMLKKEFIISFESFVAQAFYLGKRLALYDHEIIMALLHLNWNM